MKKCYQLASHFIGIWSGEKVNAMYGTQRDLSNRVNSSGQGVVYTYKSFVNGFENFKNDVKKNKNEISPGQMERLDKNVQVLGDAIKDLEQSIQTSNDPRFRRHF